MAFVVIDSVVGKSIIKGIFLERLVALAFFAVGIAVPLPGSVSVLRQKMQAAANAVKEE